MLQLRNRINREVLDEDRRINQRVFDLERKAIIAFNMPSQPTGLETNIAFTINKLINEFKGDVQMIIDNYSQGIKMASSGRLITKYNQLMNYIKSYVKGNVLDQKDKQKIDDKMDELLPLMDEIRDIANVENFNDKSLLKRIDENIRAHIYEPIGMKLTSEYKEIKESVKDKKGSLNIIDDFIENIGDAIASITEPADLNTKLRDAEKLDRLSIEYEKYKEDYLKSHTKADNKKEETKIRNLLRILSSILLKPLYEPFITDYETSVGYRIIPSGEFPNIENQPVEEPAVVPVVAPEGLALEGLAPEGLAPEGLAPEGLAPEEMLTKEQFYKAFTGTDLREFINKITAEQQKGGIIGKTDDRFKRFYNIYKASGIPDIGDFRAFILAESRNPLYKKGDLIMGNGKKKAKKGDKVVMKKSAFIKEHKGLIKLLEKTAKEGKEQAKELKKVLKKK